MIIIFRQLYRIIKDGISSLSSDIDGNKTSPKQLIVFFIIVPYFIFGDREPFIGCIEELDKAFNWAEKMGMTCVMNLSAVSNDKPGDMLVISDPKIDAVINSGRNYDLHHPRVDRVIGEGTNVPSLMGIDVRGPFTHTTNFAYQGIWSQLGDCYVTTDSDLPEVPEKEA